MNFDQLQQLWNSQSSPAPGADSLNRTADENALLKRVRTDARRFHRSIVWRDAREIVAAIFVSAAFAYIGWSAHREGAPSWPCWLAAAIPLGVAIYLFCDRLRHRLSRPESGETVRNELTRARSELSHQARLLRDVLWWYLLPLDLSAGLIALQAVLYAPTPLPVRIFAAIITTSIIALVHVCIARLNRHHLKTQLEPRIAELENHDRSFRNVSTDEN